MQSAPRPRVLLVDDDDLLRRTYRRVLAGAFEVTEARNGADALVVLQTATFDAVVTDLEMPELGGDGLVAWMEEHQPALAARVLVVTGGAKRAAQVEWLQRRDPSQVVRKPCSAETLVAALNDVLRRGEP